MSSVHEKQQGSPSRYRIEQGRVKIPGKEGLHHLTGAWRIDDPDEWQGRVPHSGAGVEFVGEAGEADAVDVLVPVLEGWGMRLGFTLEDGQVVLSEVHLRPIDPERATLGARALRQMGFTEAVKQADGVFRDVAIATQFLGDKWPGPPKRPGRAEHDPLVWAIWAQRYVDALEVNPRSPVKAIVGELRAEDPERVVTDAEVRSKVNKARDRGYLTRSPEPGKAGGELTDKARETLARLGGA